MITTRLGLEPLTSQEAETLSRATIPVLEKYGVPLGNSPELVLAATVLGVYAPKWSTRKPRAKISQPYKTPTPKAEQTPDPELSLPGPQGLPEWKINSHR